jgi:hypothetical protein
VYLGIAMIHRQTVFSSNRGVVGCRQEGDHAE